MAGTAQVRSVASRALHAMRRGAWIVLTVVVLAGLAVAADIALTWFRYGPRIAALADSVPQLTAYMQRRVDQGQPPRERHWVPLDSLPGRVVCAVLAAENVRFFRQGTLDWFNQREMLTRVLHGDFSRGGSGISQQLARNLFLDPDRTVRRKLREYVLAYQLSHTLSKERQLELYVNLVEWGKGVWGIEAGSRHLFHRSPEALTPSQLVLLVNLLPAPVHGLDFPLSPVRRSKSDLVATILWREAILDGQEWTATTSRLRREGDFVDLGLSPGDAAAAVDEEMGPERLPEFEIGEGYRLPPRVSCNPDRRGIT